MGMVFIAAAATMSNPSRRKEEVEPIKAKEPFIPYDYSKGRRRPDEINMQDYFNRIIHEDKVKAQNRKDILNELL
jgi:hypothetical protein